MRRLVSSPLSVCQTCRGPPLTQCSAQRLSSRVIRGGRSDISPNLPSCRRLWARVGLGGKSRKTDWWLSGEPHLAGQDPRGVQSHPVPLMCGRCLSYCIFGGRLDIEPNYDALARLELKRPKPQRSALQLILIIAAGVLLANAVTGFAAFAYISWEAERTAAELNAMSERWRLEAAEQQLRHERESEARSAQQAVESARHQRARAKHQAAIDSAQRTCTFWSQQVSKENSASNRSMRDHACAHVRELRMSPP